MAEPMIREAAVESQRLRDRLEDQNRTANVEKELAVLQTKFDALEKGALDSDDKADLKREMEAEMNGVVTQLREHVSTANEAQATDILSKMDAMLTKYRLETKDEQIATANQIIAAVSERRSKVVWWVLGIVGAVFVSVVSTLIVVALVGSR